RSHLRHPDGGDGGLLSAPGGGSVLRARLLRRRVPARRHTGAGGAETGPGAAAARPRARPAEVRLSRSRHLAGHQARPWARLPDLPVRPVRRILSTHRRTPHAAPGRRFSAARHVRGTALLPLPVPIWPIAGVVYPAGAARRHHPAGQGTRLRALRRRLPLRRHRPNARGAQRLSVLRPLLRVVPLRWRTGARQGATGDAVMRRATRTAALSSASLIALCVAILLTDYAIATRRAPNDDRLIKALQEQVKSDAALAPKLAGEQKRITAARLARKSRDNAIAWLLILASALFLTAAKRVVVGSLSHGRGSDRKGSIPLPDGRGSDRSRDRQGAIPSPPPPDLAFVDPLLAPGGA